MEGPIYNLLHVNHVKGEKEKCPCKDIWRRATTTTASTERCTEPSLGCAVASGVQSMGITATSRMIQEINKAPLFIGRGR